MYRSISYKLNRWRLNRNTQRNFLIYCSVAAGLLGGLAAVALKFLVHFMEELSRNISSHLPYHIIYVFLPALGILLTVSWQHLVNRDKMQKGIGNILVNIKKNRSNIRFNNIYSHLVTSSLTVGFGGSAGLEAPIVCTGAAIGSNIGQFFKLTPYEKTVLLAAGTSAGIAAVFNSPIAGVLFSLEILIGEITIPTFIPLLIASATGVVVSKVLYSGQLFHLVTEGWVISAVPFYMLLGLLSGWVSVYIAKVGGTLEKGILLKQNRYVRAIAGGMLLGLMLIVFPTLFGEGYHYLQAILNGNLEMLKEENLFGQWLSQPLLMLLFIAAMVLTKIIAAGITIGAGGNGGSFAPTLFTGAFLGLFVAFGINQTGLIHLNTSNFIAVGMAGALSGVLHAPLTAIFLIAEITGGYVLFIPLMIVSAISYIISRFSSPHNVYWRHLIHDQSIHPSQDNSMLNAIALNDLVNPQFSALQRDTLLSQLHEVLASTNNNIFPVLADDGTLEGVVLMDDIRKYIFDPAHGEETVADIMVSPPATIAHNDSMSTVMDLFDKFDVWQLPVTNEGKLIGFVSKSALLARYRSIIITRQSQQDLFA